MNMILNSKASFKKQFNPFEGLHEGVNITMENGYIQNIFPVENVNNATTSRHERHKQYDAELVRVANDQLVGIGDIQSRGLVTPLEHIGVTLSTYERVSGLTSAQVSMTGTSKGDNDQVVFSEENTPVPVFSKDITINFRQAARLRASGDIDLTVVSQASYEVTALMEDALFNGNTSIAAGGTTLKGYTTYENRNTVILAGSGWTVTSGREVIQDVIDMRTALRDHNFDGPFVLYVPTEYADMLDNDYDTYKEGSFRSRILQLEGISEIRTAKKLANNNIILVQLDRRVVDLAIAQPLTNIFVREEGLGTEHYRQMAIQVHRLKSTYQGQCGFCHGSL